MGGVLDLSGADRTGFDAIPAGVYDAVVFDAEWQKTKGGENAKLPEGSPMLNVQFKITDEEHDNSRVFNKYPLAPADYDPSKAAKLKGNFVNLLVHAGYDESKVTGGKFNLDVEDLKGREIVVVVARREWPKDSGIFVNDVKATKPAGSRGSGSGSLI